MAASADRKRFIVRAQDLPPQFPTHLHAPEFWEALGRAVASFGFLEETLGKAIFSFTATRDVPEDKFQAEYEKWLPKLQRALTDPLGNLTDAYTKAVREHGEATLTNLAELEHDLRQAAAVRNAICHGSWRIPDAAGRSVPFYVSRKLEIFDVAIDVAYLEQLREHVAALVCAIISSVTSMGWQFPGSDGPGEPIWVSNAKGAKP